MDFIHNSAATESMSVMRICKGDMRTTSGRHMSNMQLFKCVSTLLFIAGSKFKLKTSYTGTFQLELDLKMHAFL
jgi:hypothetical protein